MTILGFTCQKDDGPFLVEWIAHHFAAGFGQILVASHDCTDGSDRLMEALAQDPRILHLPFEPKGRKSVQWQALRHLGAHPAYRAADWALFFDCDEFLCAPHTPLVQLLTRWQAEGSFDALALPWRLYGSGGAVRRGDAMTPERFTQAAPLDLHFPLAHLFKTLHKPRALRQPGVHRPRSKAAKPARWRGPSGAYLPDGFASQDGIITLYGAEHAPPRLWLNHYSLRSREEFMVKRHRGLPNHQERELGLTYWAERNWNSVESREIAPMLPATRAEMDRLLALPGVRDAHERCLDWHQRRYEKIMEDLDALRLDFRLGMLTGSTPPSLEEGQAFLRRQIQLLARDKEQKAQA